MVLLRGEDQACSTRSRLRVRTLGHGSIAQGAILPVALAQAWPGASQSLISRASHTKPSSLAGQFQPKSENSTQHSTPTLYFANHRCGSGQFFPHCGIFHMSQRHSVKNEVSLYLNSAMDTRNDSTKESEQLPHPFLVRPSDLPMATLLLRAGLFLDHTCVRGQSKGALGGSWVPFHPSASHRTSLRNVSHLQGCPLSEYKPSQQAW